MRPALLERTRPHYRQVIEQQAASRFVTDANEAIDRMDDNPLTEHLPKFRELAAEARQSAFRAATPEAKRAYEDLADAWDQLLKEIDEAA